MRTANEPSERNRQDARAARRILKKSSLLLLAFLAPWRLASTLLVAALVGACGGSPPPRPVATGTAPPAGIARYLAGGDSRNDASNVIPWAFAEAKARGASAFFFLGDMDFSPEFDHHFSHELSELVPIPFYPALGKHEIKQFGALSI